MFRARDPIAKQVEKIAVYAAKLTSIIRKKTGISSNLVLYEVLFYFYFLDNAFFLKYDVDVLKQITSRLFLSLEATNNLEYQNMKSTIKVTCFKRYKTYFEIFEKYDKKFTADFFMDCFMYLSDRIVYIQEYNEFSTLPRMEYEQFIKMSVLNENYFYINKLLSTRINMFLKFLKM